MCIVLQRRIFRKTGSLFFQNIHVSNRPSLTSLKPGYLGNRYTGKQPHFGTTSSSRGEGSHFVLKCYLKIPQLDILSVYKRLKLMLANQFVELSKHLEDKKIKVYHRHSDPIFSNIIHSAVHFGVLLLPSVMGRVKPLSFRQYKALTWF